MPGAILHSMIRAFPIAALLLVFSAAAHAACRWEWFCNGEGACKQMPVCDSVYEKPGPRPEMAAPEPPPLRMRPHKLPGNMGTMSCEHIMRKTRAGKWQWDEACFCADPAKAVDPTSPFANIVRCQPPWRE